MLILRWNWTYGVLFWCLILAAGAASAHAGNGNRVGTSAAPELLIPVGARGTGMGGTGVADAAGTEALFWNPAGAAFAEGTEISFSYLEYIADIQ